MKKISLELIETLCDPALDVAKEVAEVLWEKGLDGSALKDVPGVALVVAVKDGVIAVRDRLFATKVMRFIVGVAALSPDERANAVDQLAGTAAKRERLGEVLLDKLDRADPIHKPKMLALLFVALGRGEIEATDFDRLSDMVINVFLGDLRALALRRDVADIEESRRFALQASGYLAWEVDQVYAGGGATLKWSVTNDGNTILGCCVSGID